MIFKRGERVLVGNEEYIIGVSWPRAFDGAWLVMKNGKSGYVPSSSIKKIEPKKQMKDSILQRREP